MGPPIINLRHLHHLSTIGSNATDLTTVGDIETPHVPNISVQGMGGITAIPETHVGFPTWSEPPIQNHHGPMAVRGIPLTAPLPPLWCHTHIISWHCIHIARHHSVSAPCHLLISPPHLHVTYPIIRHVILHTFYTTNLCHADFIQQKRAKAHQSEIFC